MSGTAISSHVSFHASLQADVSFQVEVGVVDLRDAEMIRTKSPIPARHGTYLLGASDFWRLMRIV